MLAFVATTVAFVPKTSNFTCSRWSHAKQGLAARILTGFPFTLIVTPSHSFSISHINGSRCVDISTRFVQSHNTYN